MLRILLVVKQRVARVTPASVVMERNGSESSDDGRGEGSARTPQGGNRRRHVSPDGTDVPASSANQNLSREDRKLQVSLVSTCRHDAHFLAHNMCPLQAIMQSFAKMEERAQRKRGEVEEEDKGRTPAAPQPGERDDGKNRGSSPIRKRPKGESGMRRRQQQNSMMDSLDDIPPLHAIPHLSTHDRLRISKPSVALPCRAKSTSLPLKKRLMQEWAEHESNTGNAVRSKDEDRKKTAHPNAMGSDSSSDEGGMQVSPGPTARMDNSRDTWRDDWRRDDDRRNSSIHLQQQSSRGGRDWGRERSSTILSFEERQKLLADNDASRLKPIPPPLRTEDYGPSAVYDGQHSHGSGGSANRGGTYGGGGVAPERSQPGAGSNRPPWGPSYSNSGSGGGGGYDRPEPPYSGAPISRMWERPSPHGSVSASSPAAPAYPSAGGTNLLWNPTLMTFQPRSGFPPSAGGNAPTRPSDTRDPEAKDYRSSNPVSGGGGAGVAPPKNIMAGGGGVAPPKIIPRDPPPPEMGYRFAPPPAATANMYLGKDVHGQQPTVAAPHIQRPPPPPPPQPGRGDADYRRVSFSSLLSPLYPISCFSLFHSLISGMVIYRFGTVLDYGNESSKPRESV